MDRTILKAVYVILISLGLALIFNFLFFEKYIGISILIFSASLLAAVSLFGRSQQLPIKKAWWLVLLILFFALMPAIRANEFLIFLNVCATFGLLMLLSQELVGTPPYLMKLLDYFALIIIGPFKMWARAWHSISLFSQVHSNIQNRDLWIRILKGIIMAVPILILFGLLFSQADLAFSQFVKGFVDINISERAVQYLALLLFAFAATLGFLSYIFFPKETKPKLPDQQDNQAALPGKTIEVLVFLALISALFLLFIGFQITYLFGGETNIISAGFTYAEYARHGFWELLAVGFLSLLVLLVSEKYAGVESKKDKHFLIPALILIAEVFVIIVSAFKRLSLYIDTYGMTMLRLYVAGFIILLLVLFILLAVKFIKSKKEHFFAFGALLSIAGFIMVADILNPDAFIIQYNMEKYKKTGKLDITYLEELSADAESQKIDLYNQLQGDDREAVKKLLLSDKANLEKSTADWQGTNLSRFKALKLLQTIE